MPGPPMQVRFWTGETNRRLPTHSAGRTFSRRLISNMRRTSRTAFKLYGSCRTLLRIFRRLRGRWAARPRPHAATMHYNKSSYALPAALLSAKPHVKIQDTFRGCFGRDLRCSIALQMLTGTVLAAFWSPRYANRGKQTDNLVLGQSFMQV